MTRLSISTTRAPAAWAARAAAVAIFAGLSLFAGCASGPTVAPLREARAGTPALPCAELAQRFAHAATRLTKVEAVPEGAARPPPGIVGTIPAHCLVQGLMHERTGAIDGKPYAIGFEMRLPAAWNGRFFYQANGGLDGFLPPAYGDALAGGPRSNGLMRGFAVISSDAGHVLDRSAGAIGGGIFGVDPQARLDYGYQAVAKLTPMAQALIAAHYGRAADRSYLVGSSNGGRHGLVAAARDSGRYDGILAITPGWRLPRAALAQLWGAQQFAAVAPRDAAGKPVLKDALAAADMATLAAAVLARCDALDGLADGIVADTSACQQRFRIERDVPTCATGAGAGGPCLSAERKRALAAVFAGPRSAAGAEVYGPLPWDSGVSGADWRAWKLEHSVGPRDAVAMAFVFATPPASPQVLNGQGSSLLDFALGMDLERGLAAIDARSGPYAESSMQFMTPPEPERLSAFFGRGAKMIVAHGVADPVFSALDSVRWFEALRSTHGAALDGRAKLYLVPGMNHSRGGPATDQFDLLEPLVAWVERGVAPAAVQAAARGAGSNLPNAEVPAAWSAQRTRLLCPYPHVARYRGGDAESAASFQCAAAP